MKEAAETIEVNGVWYDRRDTVHALVELLAEARAECETRYAAQVALANLLAKEKWQPIETAPVDEWVLLSDSGGYVSQAIYGEDEENPRWRFPSNIYLHENFQPLAWRPMPEHSAKAAVLGRE